MLFTPSWLQAIEPLGYAGHGVAVGGGGAVGAGVGVDVGAGVGEGGAGPGVGVGEPDASGVGPPDGVGAWDSFGAGAELGLAWAVGPSVGPSVGPTTLLGLELSVGAEVSVVAGVGTSVNDGLLDGTPEDGTTETCGDGDASATGPRGADVTDHTPLAMASAMKIAAAAARIENGFSRTRTALA